MSKELQYLGKYELQQRLAHGGMGEVWKAWDLHLRRYVAIKKLHANLQQDPDFVIRFEREAQLVASLHHPNIVQIYDFHISQQATSDTPLAYMVMDYVQGQTLADYLRQTSRRGLFPPAPDIIYLFTKISLAIDYAHQQGMLHRDIKPANILLDQRLPTAWSMGEPVLTDFGIARLQGVANGTIVGSLLGTPLYISPEQAQGQQGDQRSDLYSLGILLYEMLTGVTPFRGETTIAILMQHIHDQPTPPSLINPHISPTLSDVILRSIAKDPATRFPNAATMTLALTEALQMPLPHHPMLLTQQSSPSLFSPLASTPTSPSSLQVPRATVDIPASQGHVSPLNMAEAQASPVPYSGAPLNATSGSSALAPYEHEEHDAALFTPPAQAPMGYPPQPAVPPTPLSPLSPSPEASLSTSAPTRVRGWYTSRRGVLALTALIVIVLLGSAGGALRLFFSSSSQPAPSSVGSLSFSQSASAPHGSYDQLSITMRGVPPPHSGHVYYAWIESLDSERERPHWKLPFDQGTINASNLRYQGYPNLLTENTLFLVTEENEGDPPMVPYTKPEARLYYATLSQNSSTVEIKRCSSNSSNTICLQ